MSNAIRFVLYTFRGQPRHRHQAGFLRRHGLTFLAAFGGATILSMPVWMILLGVI